MKLRGIRRNVRGRNGWFHYDRQTGEQIGRTSRRVNGDNWPQEIVDRLIALRAGLKAGEPAPKRKAEMAERVPTLNDLFNAWRASAEYKSGSDATRRNYLLYSERFLARFGTLQIDAAQEDEAREAFLAFRDTCGANWVPERAEKEDKRSTRGASPPGDPKLGDVWFKVTRGGFARDGDEREQRHVWRATPRAADSVMTTVNAALNWAIDRRWNGFKVNQVEGFKRLSKADRSAIIWDDVALRAIRPHVSDEVWRMIALAALTGLSQIDLIELNWGMIYEDAIELADGRRKTGRDQMPPILPEARAILDECRAACGEKTGPGDPVFVNARDGARWTSGGLRLMIGRAKIAAGIGGRLHFHDLRGTAATQYAISEARYSFAQIALFMGWEEKSVERIARKYVNTRNVATAIQAVLRGDQSPKLHAIKGGKDAAAA